MRRPATEAAHESCVSEGAEVVADAIRQANGFHRAAVSCYSPKHQRNPTTCWNCNQCHTHCVTSLTNLAQTANDHQNSQQ